MPTPARISCALRLPANAKLHNESRMTIRINLMVVKIEALFPLPVQNSARQGKIKELPGQCNRFLERPCRCKSAARPLDRSDLNS